MCKMALYANVIVDISNGKLDKVFQYRIPDALRQKLVIGMQVVVPFGPREIKGYVVELTDQTEYEESKIKEIRGILTDSVPVESRLLSLAGWIRRNYGGTMNQAIKTVIPIKKKMAKAEKKTVRLIMERTEAKNQLAEFERKHQTARARLLSALLTDSWIEWGVVTGKLNVSGSVIRSLESLGVLKVDTERTYRNPLPRMRGGGCEIALNEEQQCVVDTIRKERARGQNEVYLLKGVTGSGKTEVYMELIAGVIAEGKQAIVLIPEIALTYQTVMRFYGRFGERVSIMNSRLSDGEKYDQFLRAKNGEIDIMIGPRSALFTPFLNLGLIIIDEEHEGSYKSETVPRYHARETAIALAKLCHADVVLGSATPSTESFYQAEKGRYRLLELKRRVSGRPLPVCHIVDLREELKSGNRSILSRTLEQKMEERLSCGQQIMLFLNRRGVAGFVSCRACGHVIKCPHCDVSLSQHNNGRMVCHYCGHEEPQPAVCPSCGSRYISGFKAGTQKIEEVVRARFPNASALRMDFDTTRKKESYEQILSAFANREADILIGTQMIVKGHDFPNVTLVGVLAADLSLHVNDYRASERTFQLLTQAAGRAGRGDTPGEVVIQTYQPEHYGIITAKNQDYEAFYTQEIAYRKLLSYPPVYHMLVILAASGKEQEAARAADDMADEIRRFMPTCAKNEGKRDLFLTGPADASVAKVNDIYKKVIYLRAAEYDTLVAVKDMLELHKKDHFIYKNVTIQFDFNPMNGF